MGVPRPRNLPVGISYLTAKWPLILVTAKRSTFLVTLAARQKTHRRKATAALRKHFHAKTCRAKTFARGLRESAAPPKAAQESLSARGAREGCGTSPCRRCIPKLRKLPRSSGLPDRAKSLRCERFPGSAAKPRG